MRRLIDPEVMRSCEAEYFRASGAASIDVMERAARALADAALERFPEARRAFVACGPGGNGGDGYACARLLREAGLEVRVYPAAPAKSADAIANAARVRELIRSAEEHRTPSDAGAPSAAPNPETRAQADSPTPQPPTDYAPSQPHAACQESMGSGPASLRCCEASGEIPDLWVDCLYGTGLSRAPAGVAAGLILRMNRDRAAGAKVIAADIPSGLNGATGARFEPCVEADLTVAFQFAKPGHLLGDGLDACGELLVADVGFPEAAFPGDLPRWIGPRDLRGMLAPRRRNIHKGSCGHLLIVASSFGMAGAAALCARAALRSGVGLVSIACPERIVPILQELAPCAMCIPLPEREGAIAAEAAEPLRAALKGKSAAVIGPGLSRRAAPEAVAAVLESGIPAVVDADALNLIAENPDLRSLLRPHHALTPHPGEAARLLDHPCANPIADAKALAGLGAAAVLKGASRVIAGKDEVYVSASGAAGMARGGSGDVYAGILGALLAEKSSRTVAQSAATACELHGLAGELAQAKYGPRGMNSSDLLEFLPEAFRRYVD